MARQGRSGVAAKRILVKLNASMDKKDYYEAHQLYRTLFFRYSSQKMYKELEDLLYDGAVKLFQCKQSGSGSDLSKLYLENMEKAEIRPSEECVLKVVKLYALIPPDLPDKEVFKNAAFRWSVDKRYPYGHPRLHQLFAHEFWKLKKYPESRYHFLYSTDGSGCGHMLAEFQAERGYPGEMDLFIVGTILQLLCLRKHIVAAIALKAYTESHPCVDLQGPPYKHPLMNFIWLLLVAIEHKESLTVYSTLLEKYQSSLSRDTSYMEFLYKIGQHFFGLSVPQRTRSGGIFGGFFDSLLSAINDDDNEDDMRPSTSTTGSVQIPSLRDGDLD